MRTLRPAHTVFREGEAGKGDDLFGFQQSPRLLLPVFVRTVLIGRAGPLLGVTRRGAGSACAAAPRFNDDCLLTQACADMIGRAAAGPCFLRFN